MTIPKTYLHDRLILLLVSVNAFLAVLTSLLLLLRLDSGRSTGYIVQYRSNVGISSLRAGDASELVAFAIFALLVAGFHIALSIQAFPIRRQVSVFILGLGAILLLLALIVSNALLTLR